MVLLELHRFWIGFCTAILANIVIAVSNTVRKKANIRKEYVPPDNTDKYVYLKDWVLWVSIILLIIGEIINFVAFALAPTFLVASEGIIAVYFTAILLRVYYGISFNYVSWFGALLAFLGLGIMVVNFPKREISLDILGLAAKIDSNGVVYYVIGVLIVLLVTACYIVPYVGSKCVSVYVVFSMASFALVGSVAVVFCRFAGYSSKYLIVSDNWGKDNVGFTALFILVTLIAICIQELCLAKFLATFVCEGTIKAIFFILRTALVAVISNLVFEEWVHVRDLNIVGVSIGFVLISIAAFLHPLFSEYNFDSETIRDQFRSK